MILPSLFSLIPAVMLLTLSFFVLVVVSKTGSKALQSFGRIIAVILWILAGVSIVACIYLSITGRYYKGSWKFPFKPHWEYRHMMR